MKLLIDFDNTIHDINHPLPGRKMGAPIVGTKEALDNFKRKGYTIIIFTVRANTEQSKLVVRKFMEYYHLPFDAITNIKENADFIIDDRAIGFTAWSDIHL